jgi:carbonic anhydrase
MNIGFLLKRYKSFYRNYFTKQNPVIKKLQNGQDPKALVISCCDSRADPAILFGFKPGEIFSIRNIANLVPNYNDSKDSGYYSTLSALEFAIHDLKIQNILIIAHSSCAGVNAIINGYEKKHKLEHSFVTQWLKIGEEIKTKNCKCSKDYEIENLKLSVRNLMSFPWIAEKVEQKTLTISAIYFNIQTGEITKINIDD